MVNHKNELFSIIFPFFLKITEKVTKNLRGLFNQF